MAQTKKAMSNNDAITKRNIEETQPANIYLFEVNNRNKRKKCEICSKLTGSFIDNFGHISYLFLVFLLFTLSKQILAG